MAETPGGKPTEEVIPDTPLVVCVISVITVLIHTLGELEAEPTLHETTAEHEVKSNGLPGIGKAPAVHALLSHCDPLLHIIRAGLHAGLTLGDPQPIVPVPRTLESFNTFKVPVTLTSPVIIAPPLPHTDISPGTVTSPSKVAIPSAFIERFVPTVKVPSVLKAPGPA